MAPKQIQVFIVDDKAIVRSTLAELINHERDLHVCGQAESGHRALREIPGLKPDVAIVDLSLNDMNGIDLVRRLVRGKESPPAVLVISLHEEGIFSADAFRAGAKGYLMKARAAETVVEAVRALAQGKTYGNADRGKP